MILSYKETGKYLGDMGWAEHDQNILYEKINKGMNEHTDSYPSSSALHSVSPSVMWYLK